MSLSEKIKNEIIEFNRKVVEFDCKPSYALSFALANKGLDSTNITKVVYEPADFDGTEENGYLEIVLDKLSKTIRNHSKAYTTLMVEDGTAFLLIDLLGDFLVGYVQAMSRESTVIVSIRVASDLRETVKGFFEDSGLITEEPPYVNRWYIAGDKLAHDKSIVNNILEMKPEAFYPYLDTTPAELWKDFKESNSNVMLFIGPPGTGKSSFIMEMLKTRGFDGKIWLADTPEAVMNSAFISAIRGLDNHSVVAVEDADSLVAKREDGNVIMSGLLNTTAGLVQTNTKIIISTNLPNLRSVDEALLRPGRMYRSIEFRALDAEEATKLREAMELPVVEFDPKGKYTLAEVLNWRENDCVRKAQKLGFCT